MLKTLRHKTSGLIAKLILGLVVLAFVATGFAGFFQSSPSSTIVAAGRTKLTAEDYLLAWRQAEVGLANRLQRRPTREEAEASGIESQVMAQLVSQAALDEQARRLDLGLSQERLAQLIADDPSFHDAAGNFSRANFRQLLSSIGMSENDFIRNRQKAAVRSQITDAVARGATAPMALKTAFGLYTGERRTVDYITLSPASVEPVAEPAADAVQAYFDKYKQRYAAPEYRSVAYVVATPETLADPASISQEAIAQYYDANKSRFATPEKRQVQQIIFPNAEAAKAAKGEATSGKSFEDIAAASGRKLADGDLGLRTRSEIPDKAIAEAAFALPEGQISDVVQGVFGPVLLRVAKIEPESVKPLAEVQDEIRRQLALQAAGEEMQQAQNNFDDARAGGASFEEAAQRAGLAVKTIPAMSHFGEGPDGQRLADLPEAEGFLQAIFAADTNAENPPLAMQPSGSLFYDVTKVEPARDRTLDEARARVIADWKTDEAQRLLGEKAEALKKRLEGGETLDQVAAGEKLSKQTAAAITRQSGPGQLGGEGTEAAFAGSEGLAAVAVGPDGQSRLLLKVVSVAPPIDPVASLRAGDVQQLDQLMVNDLVQSYVDGLREAYQIVSYPQAIERAQAMIR
ncbi:peptidylprolyl isomerase [Aureimonas endophytica]|uniref:Parvulin-like PPIase n=1 Tax=Aureimonas endophytica TaxID=2027858 RepID=A0A917E0I4_9HYPH|nr:peptidyl-prolyl cis-trans isomerase [Aureimonas endophytica]GGD89284.1 peptidylprolyl isomerase [Aureimonas endophytica]